MARSENIIFLSLWIVRPKLSDRLKMITRNLATRLYNAAVNLNIFPLRDFGNNLDRTTAKRLSQYATRLYIILFIVSAVVLTLYTIFEPRATTKTFDKPSFDVYKQLRKDYGDKLECPCSLFASTYNQSVKIKPVFHEVRTTCF
jgi:hypothetical protein